ncbi:MAG: hypothetical protein LIO70_01325 [Clostridiales bacterium]|nr:hypothetical protein [Clostridiales bacterium]
MLDYTSDPVTWTATYTLAKRYRCKTRKRFVKLLMADGISRNTATKAARAVQQLGKLKEWSVASYQNSYVLSWLCGAFDEAKEAPNDQS